MNGDIDQGDKFAVDFKAVADVSRRPVRRTDPARRHGQPGHAALATTMRCFRAGLRPAGKPVGAICHGPWTLVEADVVKGRTLTSVPNIRTDLRNAGATVVDEEVVCDEALVTSRNPDDLPAFCAKIVEEFA